MLDRSTEQADPPERREGCVCLCDFIHTHITTNMRTNKHAHTHTHTPKQNTLVLLATLLRVGDWRLVLLEYPTLLDDPAVKGLFELHVRHFFPPTHRLYFYTYRCLPAYSHVHLLPTTHQTQTIPTTTTALEPRRDRLRGRRGLPGQFGAWGNPVVGGRAGLSREVSARACVTSCFYVVLCCVLCIIVVGAQASEQAIVCVPA